MMVSAGIASGPFVGGRHFESSGKPDDRSVAPLFEMEAV